MWCKHCTVPIINLSTAAGKGVCPICGGKTNFENGIHDNS